MKPVRTLQHDIVKQAATTVNLVEGFDIFNGALPTVPTPVAEHGTIKYRKVKDFRQEYPLPPECQLNADAAGNFQQTETMHSRCEAPVACSETVSLEAKASEHVPESATSHRTGVQAYGRMISLYNGAAEPSGHVKYWPTGKLPELVGSKGGIVGTETRDALLSKRPAKAVFLAQTLPDYVALSEQLIEHGRQNDYYCVSICPGRDDSIDIRDLDLLLRPALEGKTLSIIHHSDQRGCDNAHQLATYFSQFSNVHLSSLPNRQDGNPIRDLREFMALYGTLASFWEPFDTAATGNAEAFPNTTLKLYASVPRCVAQLNNTSFSTEPTVISDINAWDFLCYDHTTIRFRDGYSLGANFECAWAIPFDIDNSHSDNPADWVHPEDMARRLKELGLSFLMVASRNHLRLKDGKAARPKFHVYLFLSAPLYDSDKFVRYCLWCIKTFSTDPQVKSKAQKIFGYGDNPNAFVEAWDGGRYIDEVLNDDELPPLDETQNSAQSTHTALPPALPANMAEAERRAIAYIAAMPEAIQGCNGSVDALRVANKLYEFGLDKETAKQVFMVYYNPRCVPHWSEKEIDHKLDTAYSKPLKEAGYMLGSQTANNAVQSASSQRTPSAVKLTRFDDIEDCPPEWFMYNKIPANDITIVSGEGGVSKTYLTCYLAAHVTHGSPWADGTPCEQGSVIFFPPEGQKAGLKRRLTANGVDLKKCLLLEGKMSYDAITNSYGVDIISLADSTWIEEAIEETERITGTKVKMIVVDPVGNFTGGSDSYKDTEVRQILAPLQRLADEKKVTFILVAHHNKADQSSAQKKVMGSGAWVNVARAHWVISVDKEDKHLRYFAPSKANDCVDATAISYRIVSQGADSAGQVQVIDMNVEKTATDLMHEQRQGNLRGRKPIESDKATDFLRSFLAGGGKPATEVYAAAKAKEISKTTLDRAKLLLDISSQKNGAGPWTWSLPTPCQRRTSED